jgi:asparagine synthase (glutamine-hydrolysing)
MRGPLSPEMRAAIRPMTRVLQHRGPDGDGFFDCPEAVLGHRRLAIIDREGGAQPMTNETGTAWIVFNGEIYNHRALRARLESLGHQFATACDTEVILHAYEEFGASCVERLEGMFAFAIYNTRTHELFAARDRVGKKPLYFAVLDDVLHVASEIKAIALSPLWNDQIDHAMLDGYLSLGYIPAPYTIYTHVKKLPPAHWLRLRNGTLELRSYWDIREFDTDTREEPALIDDLEAALREAVAERLESEVPLGAFLSGGIDSGVVSSLLAELSPRPPVTISVGFGTRDQSELDDAQSTATLIKSEHYPEPVEPVLHEVLERVVYAFDEPFADPSAIPTYYAAQAAKRHVTVALTGDGGDEAFGGYDLRYFPHRIEERIRAYLPGAVGRRALRRIGAHWPNHPLLPRATRLGNVMQNLGGDPADAYYRDLCFTKPGLVQRLLGRTPTHHPHDGPIYEAITWTYRRCPSKDAVQCAQYADLHVYLPEDVLVKVDRMSMLHALEVRCPMLDRRILELAFRIPAARKTKWPQGKRLLRAIAARRLSPECAARPKRGFDAPLQRWTTTDYSAHLERDLLGSGSTVKTLLDPLVIRELFNEHRSGGRDHSHALWSMWMLEWWYRGRRQQPDEAAVLSPRNVSERTRHDGDLHGLHASHQPSTTIS